MSGRRQRVPLFTLRVVQYEKVMSKAEERAPPRTLHKTSPRHSYPVRRRAPYASRGEPQGEGGAAQAGQGGRSTKGCLLLR